MRIAQPNLFNEFEPVIRGLPMCDRFEREDLLIPSLRLHEDAGLEMYYAPFGSVNSSAVIALLGITPGWTQMEIAYRVARKEVEVGTVPGEICKRAKQNASFAGTMRTNLIRMLDDLLLPSCLGIETTSDLFGSASALVHTGSAIRYPVFVNGRNYTGHTPGILAHPFLRECIESVLAPELASVPDALVVPLGNAVSAALEHLAALGKLSAQRCLFGFPHPSGANGRRLKDFAARRQELTEKVAVHFRERVASMGIHTTASPPFGERVHRHVGARGV
ncbi:MAG: hypothetical protein ACHQ9S_09895 [Candidatus Binatia bacterium]